MLLRRDMPAPAPISPRALDSARKQLRCSESSSPDGTPEKLTPRSNYLRGLGKSLGKATRQQAAESPHAGQSSYINLGSAASITPEHQQPTAADVADEPSRSAMDIVQLPRPAPLPAPSCPAAAPQRMPRHARPTTLSASDSPQRSAHPSPAPTTSWRLAPSPAGIGARRSLVLAPAPAAVQAIAPAAAPPEAPAPAATGPLRLARRSASEAPPPEELATPALEVLARLVTDDDEIAAGGRSAASLLELCLSGLVASMSAPLLADCVLAVLGALLAAIAVSSFAAAGQFSPPAVVAASSLAALAVLAAALTHDQGRSNIPASDTGTTEHAGRIGTNRSDAAWPFQLGVRAETAPAAASADEDETADDTAMHETAEMREELARQRQALVSQRRARATGWLSQLTMGSCAVVALAMDAQLSSPHALLASAWLNAIIAIQLLDTLLALSRANGMHYRLHTATSTAVAAIGQAVAIVDGALGGARRGKQQYARMEDDRGDASPSEGSEEAAMEAACRPSGAMTPPRQATRQRDASPTQLTPGSRTRAHPEKRRTARRSHRRYTSSLSQPPPAAPMSLALRPPALHGL